MQGFARHAEYTAGPDLLDYWRGSAFDLPGEVGSVQSLSFLQHDVHHVLTGYDTTPHGERAVAGFPTGAGVGDADRADYAALVRLQLRIAAQAAPTVAPWRDRALGPPANRVSPTEGSACRTRPFFPRSAGSI